MRHNHGIHGDGGLVHRPGWYEITSTITFGGRRRAIYDGLVDLSGATSGDHVLDVGCGPGYLTRRAARAVGPTGRAEGIDPAPEVIAYATRHAPANASFKVAAAERLPQSDDAFDVVVSSLAIHHIEADQRPVALAEMRRVLRPEGRLLIVEIGPPRNRLLRRLRSRAGGHGPDHDVLEALPTLLADAGFDVTGQGERPHGLRYFQATPRR